MKSWQYTKQPPSPPFLNSPMSLSNDEIFSLLLIINCDIDDTNWFIKKLIWS